MEVGLYKMTSDVGKIGRKFWQPSEILIGASEIGTSVTRIYYNTVYGRH